MISRPVPIHARVDSVLLESLAAFPGDPEKAHLAVFMLGGRLARRRPDLWDRYEQAHHDIPAAGAEIDLMLELMVTVLIDLMNDD